MDARQTPAQLPPGFEKAARAAIEREGYALQHAVLAAPIDRVRQTDWRFRVAEFPVSVKGHDTRVDLIIEHMTARWTLVVETKRVYPGSQSWLFMRTPSLASSLNPRAIFDVVYPDVMGVVKPSSAALDSRKIVDLAAVVRHTANGEKAGDEARSRMQIEETLSQVFKQVNGYIHHLAELKTSTGLGGWPSIPVVPVIVTTAALVSTTTDLSKADLDTGKLPDEPLALQPVDWVALQYPVSRGIRHTHLALTVEQVRDVARAMELLYLRTAFIVRASALGKFLEGFASAVYDVKPME